MNAYLHPQEVFSALRNRSRLNSLLCQHLLQFSLQSKQKADVSQGKKELVRPMFIPRLLEDFRD